MSFGLGLSGLNAASSELNVTANNIANVGTTGFKYSRGEFYDVYAISVTASASTTVGDGALLGNVRQIQSQGSLEYTDNALDLAINGQGFFMTSSDPDTLIPTYTRNGSFGTDAEGYLVDGVGKFLQTFPTDPITGDVIATSKNSATSVKVTETFGTANPTTTVGIAANLPATSEAIDPALFDPTNVDTYTASTNSTVYDSLGQTHTVETYFIHTDVATNTWETRSYFNGNALTPAVGAATTLNFDGSGALVAPAGGEVQYSPELIGNGSDPIEIMIDFTPPDATSATTQQATPFFVPYVEQDGTAVGRLSGLAVKADGNLEAKYSNGRTISLGRIIAADFENTTGLRQAGNTSWQETFESGTALIGSFGTERFGNVQGGALESSNVDLTAQLVKLITAQRNFQANAKTIETSNTLTQTIVNI